MCRAALTTVVLGAILRTAAQIVDPAQAAANIIQREDTLTSTARFNLLNGLDVSSRQRLAILGTILSHDPPQFIYDFDASVSDGKEVGGNIIVANLADLPSLVCRLTPLAGGNAA